MGVFLLQVSHFIVQSCFIASSTGSSRLMVSRVDCVALNDLLGKVSDLLELLPRWELVVDILFKVSELLPSVSHLDDIVNKLGIVFRSVHVVFRVEITVLKSS